MAFDEHLAERIRIILQQKKRKFEEKKMMGGLAFMVNEKMCVGIVKKDLMARVGPDNYEIAIQKKGARQMDFTGKPMKGYVFVSPKGVDMDEELEFFVDLALQFNKDAKSYKK